jgi:puromycin-sensitive aminopeptidase
VHYKVELSPDLTTCTFSGHVAITVEVTEESEALVLNAIDLELEAATIDGTAVATGLDPETERLTLTADTPLRIGEHVVNVSFSGVINDLLRGLYRSTFTDDDGTDRVIATTQMQATDCRRVFPCWDEPEAKATFGITLVVDDTLVAVSNGAEVARSPREGGRVAVTFADTMPMSTYLVAMVVGPLEITSVVDVDGIDLRVVHVPGKGDLTGFAIDVASFCLRWFQNYYGIAYPGDKVDLVALPDFAAGAMENLGCITFRENLLLVDPASATQPERQVVADVVAHELAHMWFGDLVTMRWWNGIWLNEAFATFMELAACDAYRPDWERWLSFGLERSAAFETDALTSTRPIEFDVRSPADAEGMFDILTYIKGGAVLRMLEQYLGSERFRDGVRHYLETHSYSSTETSDLWDALETTSGEPVRRLMDSWIWQPGHPIVSASTADDGTVTLRQQRFSWSDDASDTTYVVPVVVRTDAGIQRLLLESEPVSITVGTTGAVVVNHEGHGFYRVGYDHQLRERLVHNLHSLEVLERYHLVDDLWNEVLAGRATAEDMLNLITAMSAESTLAVWQAMINVVRQLARVIPAERRAGFATTCADICRPAFHRLGDPQPGDTELDASLRGLLIRTLGTLGADSDTIAYCRSAVDQARAGASVDAEVLAAATVVVAQHGDAAEHAALTAAFESADTPQEQLRNLYALAEFDDADLVDATARFALTSSVRTQNAPFVLRACMANPAGGRRVWDIISDAWDDINERFPTNTIVRMVDPVKWLVDDDDLEHIPAFFAARPIAQATITLRQILERQQVNAALGRRIATEFISP